MTADVLKLVLVNACLLAAGSGVTRALGMWARPAELLRVLGTSFVTGVAAYGVVAQMLYVLGFSLNRFEALVLCAAISSVGAVPWLPATSPRAHVPRTRFEPYAALLVLIPLALLAVDAALQPLSSWDAWSQWTPKARSLVLLDGLDPAVFANAAYAGWHPDYPLLVPGLEALAFRFIGLNTRVVHLEFWFLLVGFATALLELLRPRAGVLLAWVAVIAIAWTPKVGSETVTANADMPLAVFIVLAGLTAWLWVSEADAPALGLFALFGAAALATKLEGAFELAILFVVALVLAARRSRRRAVLLTAAGAATLAGILPWRLWTAWHDTPTTFPASGLVDRLQNLEPARVPISTLGLLHQLFEPSVWLLLVPLALCAVLVAVVIACPRQSLAAGTATAVLVTVGLVAALALPGHSFEWRSVHWALFIPAVLAGCVIAATAIRRGGTAAYTMLSLCMMFAAFVVIYTFTPFDFAWHLGTSASRVVLPIGLLAAAFMPLVLGRAFAESEGSEGEVE